MSNSDARERYRQRVQEALEKADKEFRGQYATEIKGLLALTPEEIDAFTPDTTDIETYNKLLIVVKEASNSNVSAAVLGSEIKSLGSLAVNIAKKVPSLATLVV